MGVKAAVVGVDSSPPEPVGSSTSLAEPVPTTALRGALPTPLEPDTDAAPERLQARVEANRATLPRFHAT
jgi:hypothetical protein